MSAISPTRIALVDDHPSVIEGLRGVIARHGDLLVCGAAQTAGAAHVLMRESRPDVGILDLSLPDGDGLPWVAKLMSEYPRLKIVLHTLHCEQHILRNALQMQVAGYVLKSSDPESVVHAVRAARAGGTYVDPVLMSRALERGMGARGLAPDGVDVKISKRELETLRLTALGYGIKEIADDLKVSAKSIETYKLRGAEKLGLKTRSAIVRHAIASGWFSTIE